jgi:hypothetical protein
VCQDRNGAAKNARWTVEIVENATATQDWVLGDVDVVQIRVESLPSQPASELLSRSESSSSEASSKIELMSPQAREEV